VRAVLFTHFRSGFTRLLSGGLARLRRGLPAMFVAGLPNFPPPVFMRFPSVYHSLIHNARCDAVLLSLLPVSILWIAPSKTMPFLKAGA